MTKERFFSIVLPLILIPIGVFVMIALTLALYVGLFFAMEAMYPAGFNVGALRMYCTAALTIVCLFLLRFKLPEVLKAILLGGPLAAAIITTGNGLYMQPVVAIIAMFLVIAISGGLLYYFKKPWFYFYAGAIAALLALFYAWPRPDEYQYGLAPFLITFLNL